MVDPATSSDAATSVTASAAGRMEPSVPVARQRKWWLLWSGVSTANLQPRRPMEILSANPLGGLRRNRGRRALQEVDRHVVVNPRQARELMAAVTYAGGYERARWRRLRAFFGCLYYAALRSAEALVLRLSDCTVPDRGWGFIDLAETRPTAGYSVDLLLKIYAMCIRSAARRRDHNPRRHGESKLLAFQSNLMASHRRTLPRSACRPMPQFLACPTPVGPENGLTS